MQRLKFSLALAASAILTGGILFAQNDADPGENAEKPAAEQQERQDQNRERSNRENRDEPRPAANRDIDDADNVPGPDARPTNPVESDVQSERESGRDALRNRNADRRNLEDAAEETPAPPGTEIGNGRNARNRDAQNRDARDRNALDRNAGNQNAQNRGEDGRIRTDIGGNADVQGNANAAGGAARNRDALGVQFRTDDEDALIVGQVRQNALAARAGLQPNDQIVSVDGRTFDSPDQLTAFLTQNPGRRVPIVVLRDGQRETLYWQFDPAAVGGPAQARGFAGPQGHRVPENPNGPAFGIILWDSPSGVFVRQTQPGSPAYQAGLQPNDRIVSMNGQSFQNYQDFIAAAGQSQIGQGCQFVIERNGQQFTHQLQPQQWGMVYNNQPGQLSGGQALGPDGGQPFADGRQPYGVARPGFDQMRAGNVQQDLDRLNQRVQQLERELQQLRSQVRQFHGDEALPQGGRELGPGAARQFEGAGRPPLGRDRFDQAPQGREELESVPEAPQPGR